MSSSTRRPARRSVVPTKTGPTTQNNNLMSRRYSNSFSGIDWGGMLSGSVLYPSKRVSDFSAGSDSFDLPSMGGESGGSGGGGPSLVSAQSSTKKKNKKTNNDNDDDVGNCDASIGSKMLVEHIQQTTGKTTTTSATSSSSGVGGVGMPLWKELKSRYVPTNNSNSKDRQQHRVSFNLNLDEEDDDDDDDQKIVPAKRNSDKERQEAEESTPPRWCPSSSSWCLVLVALAIVLGGVRVLTMVLGGVVKVINFPQVHQQQQQQQEQEQLQERGQELLELAEQITIACGESSLLRKRSSSSSSSSVTAIVGAVGATATGGHIVDTKSGMATCQELCHNHMCCVVEEEEEGEYSCKDDVTMDCAVYAGCVALIDDNFW